MVDVVAETAGLRSLRDKVRRMPLALQREVRAAAIRSATHHSRQAKLAARSGRVRGATRAEALPGSKGTAWRSRQGGGAAWFAHLEESGTRPGLRVHRRGPRKGIQMRHPGTRGTGGFFGSYRLNRTLYRRNFANAYRRAARSIRDQGGSLRPNLTGSRLTDLF